MEKKEYIRSKVIAAALGLTITPASLTPEINILGDQNPTACETDSAGNIINFLLDNHCDNVLISRENGRGFVTAECIDLGPKPEEMPIFTGPQQDKQYKF